jgi:hypothetical protein
MNHKIDKKTVYGKIRRSVEVDMVLCKEIQELADEKIWSWSEMSYHLLRSAVAERKRKRATKEDNT